MLNNASLKTKLFLGFGVGCAVLMMVASVSIWALRDVSSKYEHVAQINLGNADKLSEMLSSALSIESNLTRMGLPSTGPSEIRTLVSEIQTDLSHYDLADKAYNEIPFVEGEEKLYNDQNTFYKDLTSTAKKMVEQAERFHTSKEARAEYLRLLEGRLFSLAHSHRSALEILIEFQNKKEAPKWVALAEESAKAGTLMTMILSIVGFLASLGIGFQFSRSLTSSLGNASNSLSEGSTQVSAAASQIAGGAQQLSSGATTQAASIEETSSSVQELTVMVENNVKSAETAVNLSQTAQEGAEKGVETMGSLMEAMKQILESNTKIEGLVKVIEEIGEKTAIIDEIVFQTKLLSFNASVEAERAGEHGRGFAVVAQEVGNLAQMSGKAATEITTIVKTSTKDAQGIAKENRERVEKGSDFANSALEIIKDLRTRSSKVYTAADQIVTASKEQSTGLRQISKAMESLNQVTQQNASNTEEAAAAAEELSSQAVAVDNVVQNLRQLVYGRSSSDSHSNRKVAHIVPRDEKVSSISRKSPSSYSMPLKRAAGDGSSSFKQASNGNGFHHDSNGSDSEWEKL